MTNLKHENLMSGNDAIVQGALEAGVGFCASYPGTPSTEIATALFNFSKDHNIYVEWSTNEKVALEAATGASWAGIPALCSMKSLGLNVASDFLLNVNLSGTGKGGLVIVVCDDPRGHSSSNEQDSRFYAKAAQIPLLEPSTYQETKDTVQYAFEISQKFELPVLVRSTTRLSHSRGLVSSGRIPKQEKKVGKFPSRLYNVPNPHLRHRELLEKTEKVSEEFERVSFNSWTEHTKSELLVISSGISSLYTQEAISLLDSVEIEHANIVTTYPLPSKKMTSIVGNAEQVLFVEEVDPFLEDGIRGLYGNLKRTPRFLGKRSGHIPAYGEMNTDIVRGALIQILGLKNETEQHPVPQGKLATRPLTFCAGCTHRNFYWALRKVKKRLKGDLIVAGDIGCYSLGVFYDEAMNTMQAMGSGIGVACGLGQLGRFGFDAKVVAVAGDSTFFHACLPGLVNARHKNANLTFVILDNATTAMTGFQVHPGSSVQDTKFTRVDIESLVKAINPDFYATGDATNIREMIDLLQSTVNRDGLKVLLLDSICRLEEARREPIPSDAIVAIDRDLCRGERCKICISDFGCPAINWDSSIDRPVILDKLCIQCGACIDVCPHNAIREEERR